VETRMPLPVAYTRGEQTLLIRALCNLVDNAIKYSASGTRIECGIDEQPSFWRVRIKDQGQGIAAQDVARLFEPFARVGVETRGDVGGAGLGLAFVHTVAKRHGGRIEVQSEPGVGSEFILHLPKV